MLSSLFFLTTLLQVFVVELYSSSIGLIFGRVVDIVIMGFLLLIPVSFLALLSGVMLGNRDKRHILLTIILGTMIVTVVLGNVLVARMSNMI